MKPHLIVIPYLAEESQGHELRLAVEGWHQFFREPHLIVVIGDNPRIRGVKHIPFPRVPAIKGQYHPHLDIAAKFAFIIRAYRDLFDGFIFSCDDYYAVNDFSFEDVCVLKVMPDTLPTELNETAENLWRRDMARTGHLCAKEGFGLRNYTTHLPQYFQFDKLQNIIDRYNLTSESKVIESLYFNIYYKDVPADILDGNDRWKFGVYYAPMDREGLYNAFTNKVWVANSAHGWSEGFEKAMADYYGIKI